MLFTHLYLFLQKNDDIAKYIANQLKQKTSKATKSKLEETNLMNGHAAGQKSGKFVTLVDFRLSFTHTTLKSVNSPGM